MGKTLVFEAGNLSSKTLAMWGQHWIIKVGALKITDPLFIGQSIVTKYFVYIVFFHSIYLDLFEEKNCS